MTEVESNSKAKMKQVDMFTLSCAHDQGAEKKVQMIVSHLEKHSYVFVKLDELDEMVKRGRLDLYHQLSEQYDWIDIKSDPVTFKNYTHDKPKISGIGNVDFLPESCLKLQVYPKIVDIFRAALKVSEYEELVAKMDAPQVVPPGQSQTYIGYEVQESDVCGLLTLTDQLMMKDRSYVPASTLLLFKRDSIHADFFHNNPDSGVLPWLGLRVGFFKKGQDPLQQIRADLFYHGRFGVHLKKRKDAVEEMIKKRMTKFARHNKNVMHMYASEKPRDIKTIRFPLKGQIQIGANKTDVTRKRTHVEKREDIIDDIKKKRTENVHVNTDENNPALSSRRKISISKFKQSEKPSLKRGLTDRVQRFNKQALCTGQKVRKESKIGTMVSRSSDRDILGSIMNKMNNSLVSDARGEIQVKHPNVEEILEEMTTLDDVHSPLPSSPFPEWNSSPTKLTYIKMPDSFVKKQKCTSPKKETYKLKKFESSYRQKLPVPRYNRKDPRTFDKKSVEHDNLNHSNISTTTEGYVTGNGNLKNLREDPIIIPLTESSECLSEEEDSTPIDSDTCVPNDTRQSAADDAKNIVDKLYEEDMKSSQKTEEHSLKNKTVQSREKYLDISPSTLNESSGVYYCNSGQVTVYHRRGIAHRDKGLSDTIIVCNNDKQGDISVCFAQPKSMACTAEEIRGASTVQGVLKSYAIAYNENFGHSQRKGTPHSGRTYKKNKCIFRIEIEENEDENQILMSAPEKGRVYTIIKMPKLSLDSEHIWFDPNTENDETDRFDYIIDRMIRNSQRHHAKLKKYIKTCMKHVGEREIDTVLMGDMEKLHSQCEDLEHKLRDEVYDIIDFEKITTSIEYRLDQILLSLMEHISYPRIDVKFSDDNLIGLMKLFSTLEKCDMFGFRHFFYRAEEQGFSYSDIICNMALPNRDQFVHDVWEIVKIHKEYQ